MALRAIDYGSILPTKPNASLKVAGQPKSAANQFADPYQSRTLAAVKQLCRPDYPAGMIPWLEAAHPEYHRLLTTILPDRIDELWRARAPIKEFDGVLARLVETHRLSCKAYLTENSTEKKLSTGNLKRPYMDV